MRGAKIYAQKADVMHAKSYFGRSKNLKKMSSIPNVSNKEKQKNKPRLNAGSKDEKRRMKKEKLAKELGDKKKMQESMIKAKEPVQPVTLGKEFYDALDQISSADISSSIRKPGKKLQTLNAVEQMKQIFAQSTFSNPTNIFNAVDNQLEAKTRNLQAKLYEEEQKRIEKEKLEKMKQNEGNTK